MDKELDKFISDVLTDINAEITNIFFSTVEENKRFRTRYNKLCLKYDKNIVNRRLGRLIKEKFNLSNTGKGTVAPRLIKSYTKH